MVDFKSFEIIERTTYVMINVIFILFLCLFQFQNGTNLNTHRGNKTAKGPTQYCLVRGLKKVLS